MALGLASNRLELHPYSEEWPHYFSQEKARIEAAIGNDVLDIQHVGSTSVPGLMAKPIIDIGIAVEDFTEAHRCVEPMERIGYIYRGENGIPRRHYFKLGDPTTHHVHMNEISSDDWKGQISFRDALRNSAELAEAYAQLKQELAASNAGARMAYSDSKTGFITKVLVQAMPSLLPTVGEEIVVRSFKADSRCYRWWQSCVAASSESEIVTSSPPGSITWHEKGEWRSRYSIRTTYWFDKPYNLLEVKDSEGQLVEIYVNIGSPALLKDGEIHFRDYELDVVRFPGEKAKVVDEDEFAAAAKLYAYTERFQAFCYESASEALRLADSWVIT